MVSQSDSNLLHASGASSPKDELMIKEGKKHNKSHRDKKSTRSRSTGGFLSKIFNKSRRGSLGEKSSGSKMDGGGKFGKKNKKGKTRARV